MKSHMIARFEGVCAHLPLRRSAVLLGERGGSGNSWGWERVETMLLVGMLVGVIMYYDLDRMQGEL